MVNKSLVWGISGFILGGLLVSIAATTFDKNDSALQDTPKSNSHASMSMEQMTASLTGLEGDAYDKAFVASMIEHHQSAVDMANLSPSRAKHDEIKQLSQDIIIAQKKEISDMKQWQSEWGYSASRELDGMELMSH